MRRNAIAESIAHDSSDCIADDESNKCELKFQIESEEFTANRFDLVQVVEFTRLQSKSITFADQIGPILSKEN